MVYRRIPIRPRKTRKRGPASPSSLREEAEEGRRSDVAIVGLWTGESTLGARRVIAEACGRSVERRSPQRRPHGAAHRVRRGGKSGLISEHVERIDEGRARRWRSSLADRARRVDEIVDPGRADVEDAGPADETTGRVEARREPIEPRLVRLVSSVDH